MFIFTGKQYLVLPQSKRYTSEYSDRIVSLPFHEKYAHNRCNFEYYVIFNIMLFPVVEHNEGIRPDCPVKLW